MADFSAKHYMIKSEKNAVRAGEEADRAESYANSLQPDTFVKTSGNQTINGTKTFTNAPKIVNTSGQNTQILLSDTTANSEIWLMQATSNGRNQFLIRFDNGNKYPFVISQDASDNTKFSFTITSTPSATSNTTEIATTAWVRSKICGINYASPTAKISEGGTWTANSTYTVPSQGFVIISSVGRDGQVKVNGIVVGQVDTSGGSGWTSPVGNVFLPVKSGDKITTTTDLDSCYFYFWAL